MSSRADFYAMVEIESRMGDVVVLDSQLATHPSSGKSWLFAGFDAIFKWNQETDGDSSSVGDPWKALAGFRSRFPGFCCGYLGYDLKNAREVLQSANNDTVGLPDMWMARPTRIYMLEDESDEGISHTPNFTITSLRSSVSSDHYMRMVEKAKAFIHEGDTYEINLSHQLQGDFEGNPLSLFHTMRQHGPVPFAAYLQVDDLSACCASPERFLTKKAQKLISDPIKGTRPRGINPEQDAIIATELRNSEKDQAENLMIVDLVRNDFSRACQAGSVKVTQLFDIQRFGTVHQMVSRVEGDLSETLAAQPEEAIAACFPMGSMTGAPKIRSMKIIEELENYKRGLYSGAIGFFTPEGDFSFNVVIRTAIIRDKKLWYSTGGAITADSDPLSEWNETLVKARALQTEILS